jgi:hypothetical protein
MEEFTRIFGGIRKDEDHPCACQCGAGVKGSVLPMLGLCRGCTCGACVEPPLGRTRVTVTVKDYSDFAKRLCRAYKARFGFDPEWYPPRPVRIGDLRGKRGIIPARG